jgi:hypothetical protein
MAKRRWQKWVLPSTFQLIPYYFHFQFIPLMTSNVSSPFECPICLEFYDEKTFLPTTLRCGHSLCLRHISEGDIRRCSVCQLQVDNTTLEPNFSLRDAAVLFGTQFRKLQDGASSNMTAAKNRNKSATFRSTLCKFYNTNKGCRSGSECPFLHAAPSSSSSRSRVDSTASGADTDALEGITVPSDALKDFSNDAKSDSSSPVSDASESIVDEELASKVEALNLAFSTTHTHILNATALSVATPTTFKKVSDRSKSTVDVRLSNPHFYRTFSQLPRAHELTAPEHSEPYFFVSCCLRALDNRPVVVAHDTDDQKVLLYFSPSTQLTDFSIFSNSNAVCVYKAVAIEVAFDDKEFVGNCMEISDMQHVVIIPTCIHKLLLWDGQGVLEHNRINGTCRRCHKICTGKCARCKLVQYCSRECQVADWKDHKEYCAGKEQGRRHCRMRYCCLIGR